MSKRNSKIATCNRKDSEDVIDVDAPRKWTVTEQNKLQHLIDTGDMSLNDGAAKLKDKDPTFREFSNSVIGYHLALPRKNKLKSKQPLSGVNGTGVVASVNDVFTQHGIIPTNSLSASNVDIDGSHVGSSYELSFDNMPFLRFSYMKYAKKQEKLVVILDLPGGSSDFNWEFNEVGDGIIIVVNWSRSLYDVGTLFRSHLDAAIISLEHPKLHAMQNEALRQGYSSKQISQWRLKVDLGKRFHKDDGTWSLDSFQHEGNKILLLEFSGFQEETLKKEKRGKFA
ncbi:hypothetical protein Bhyg_12162 [Pseudolycoriella hygida]|uniref:Uncharacterized protein n=1 Tax=Pseudolycoriella hygida TaxID=35572 RepID=A0A9Q0S0X6_9DIPT|nr:hypothetical protein Bhyg_12162 [Pseudolycoriella hygida]